jgi:glycosyltransferase involved in cell wall biosynthesis
MRCYEIPESKITVIPLGVETTFKPMANLKPIEEVRKAYGLSGPFFFYIGTIFPRRNVPNLIKGFKLVLEKHREAKLLIVGENHLIPKLDLNRMFNELELSDHVIWRPYIPEQDLVPLYCASEALVYPSSYEGFGLPVLEAMACGTPVVTTRCASLPEVAGEAGLFVDPQDLEEIAEAMLRVLEDFRLRIRLREMGFQRASAFPWSKTAQETLEVMRKAANT